MNHLALTLANEEKDITTVSIRPGVVDTQMQDDLRSKHHAIMDKEDAAKFFDAKESGKLLKPEKPGNVIARLVASAPKALSGAFLRYSWQFARPHVFQGTNMFPAGMTRKNSPVSKTSREWINDTRVGPSDMALHSVQVSVFYHRNKLMSK